ncbi:uncharacterized protein LOC104448835 [Eucalyptus grandis]|nr:uncharacterized protein LOC104448835 [Eucalyptus grandis]
MHNKPQVEESFVIQVRGEESSLGRLPPNKSQASSITASKLNLSSMKLFNRFRKIIMRLVFPSFAPRSGSSASPAAAGSRHRNSCDKPEPPKSSFSSYYSSQSHYNEAIADCIEFFNKSSSQDGFPDGRRRSDVMV